MIYKGETGYYWRWCVLQLAASTAAAIHSSNATDRVTSMMIPVCCMWQALFSREFGEVVSAMVYDKSTNADGRPVPKYGFVTFRKVEDCLKALNARVSPAGWSSPPPFVCLYALTEKRMPKKSVFAN